MGGSGAKGRRWRRICKRALVVVALAWIALEVGLRLTPLPEGLEAGLAESPVIVGRDGEVLRTLLVEEERFTREVELKDIAYEVIQATVAAEDKRFWRHGGVDLLALGRAVTRAVGDGRVRSGASTITQQLVKLSRPRRERTVWTKLEEMWLAMAVERDWTKAAILEAYLNRLDYGGMRVGIAAASWGTFGKPPSDLSAAEAAFLAGLPVAPGRLSPTRNPEGAAARQRWVLGRMRATGKLDADAFARAVAEPLAPTAAGREFEAPHFVDLMLQRRGAVPARGGEVRTTLDLGLNRFVETVLAENLAGLRDKNVRGGAVVVIDNASGEVIALAGSGDYFEAGAGQVNGAWAVRSPGSAMKPFGYLLGLQAGLQPCSVIADVPSEFATPTGLYRPNNYNHRFYGPVGLREALGNSLNVAAVRVLQAGGGPEALHQLMRQLGVSSFGHPAEYYGLGLVLGNGEVRLLELTNAYAALARLGEWRPYRLLAGEEGGGGASRRVCDEATAYLLAEMLSDNGARAGSFGLNSYLRFDYPVACKTGTSSNYRDNWTMAYTPEFTVGVWVGNPDGRPMREVTGLTGAAPVMWRVMEHLRQTRGTSWYRRPDGVAAYRVDPLTGRLAPEGLKRAVAVLCRNPPGEVRGRDYDDAGRVKLGEVYTAWLESEQNGLGELVAPGGDVAGLLEIVRPVAGAEYFVDGDLPGNSQWVRLEARGASGEVEWGCETLEVGDGGRIKLGEGRHEIVARDPVSGREARTWIVVGRW